MKQGFSQDVYDSLRGLLVSPVPGVENLFSDGSVCDTCYNKMLDACDRICSRLGVPNEDADLEIVRNCLQTITDTLCLQMYEYGKKFGQIP